jgi:hypothetical protein
VHITTCWSWGMSPRAAAPLFLGELGAEMLLRGEPLRRPAG